MSATSQDKEKFEDYDRFIEKFKPKKTTDDCYTPENIYNAVAEWVVQKYQIDMQAFTRPFYPGGDYVKHNYSGKVVVDNPPFSKLAEIIKFYVKNNIKFFLFSPALVGVMRYSDYCTVLAVGVSITYANGAIVNTSFVTNLEPSNIRMRTEPDLYNIVDNANKTYLATTKKQLPKYSYPVQVVTAASLSPYSRYGIEFTIQRDESARIVALDAQKKSKKGIYGCGLLLSERLTAERQKIELQKIEQQKIEQQKIELQKVERWQLSQREHEIIKRLSKK